MLELTLKQANQLVEQTLSTARQMGLPPLAVAVLDAGGHLKSLQREDGVSFLRVQICQSKAWGALGLGTDTGHIAERYSQSDQQQGFINALNAMSGGRVIPLAGGVLIHGPSGHILGAVGVSGAESSQDEACAKAGIQAVGLQ